MKLAKAHSFKQTMNNVTCMDRNNNYNMDHNINHCSKALISTIKGITRKIINTQVYIIQEEFSLD